MAMLIRTSSGFVNGYYRTSVQLGSLALGENEWTFILEIKLAQAVTNNPY